MDTLPNSQGQRPYRVLMTGAAGRIGRVLRTKLTDRYALLRVADILPLEENGKDEIHHIDLTDPASLDPALADIDCVVHLAGQGFDAEWDLVLNRNIIGTYNLFEAARLRNVRRFIFASSHHAVGFHKRDETIGVDALPRPDSLYGASKVFGESLGRLYADKYGMEVASIRIGVFRDKPEDTRHLSVWVSEDDFAQLIQRCIEAPKFHYLTLYGVSANTRAFWTNPDAKKIGYVPKDDAERFAAGMVEMPTSSPEVTARFQGGFYCARNFVGDPGRVP